MVRTSSALSVEQLANCAFEIVMVDDRVWRRVNPRNAPYWVMAAVLNRAYASRFGYAFRLVRPRFDIPTGTTDAPSYPGWHKVMYLAERLLESEQPWQGSGTGKQEQCRWLLYLDGDAFVREHDLPLPAFLSGLATRYPSSPATSVIFAAEQPVVGWNITAGPVPGGVNPAAPFLNTGVFLVRAGAGSSAAHLFRSWLAAAAGVVHRRLWTSWPGEQGVLSELVRPGTYSQARSNAPRSSRLRNAVLVINQTEMNSPWGRFVQHSWGREATEALLRTQALTDALLRIGVAEPKRFRQLVREAQDLAESWLVWPHFESGLAAPTWTFA